MMDIQSAAFNELFVLYPVIIPGWVSPVKPADSAHGGIPKALYDGQAQGLECLVDPWTELQLRSWIMAVDDRVDLYCNGDLVPGAGQIVKPGEEQLRQRLYLPHGYLMHGVNRLHYVVTRVGGNSEISRDLLVLYHLRPADNLNLVIPADVLRNGVSAERAAQGVAFGFTYANRRNHDRIEFLLGDTQVRFDVPDGTAPITHTLFTDTFQKAGNNPSTVAEFYVVDQLGNRAKSTEKRLDIHLDRVELEEAILREILTENNDDPALVDLAKLSGGPLWALIHLVEKIWSVGDEIHLTFTALVNGSPVASHEATLPITQVPGQFSWDIPNSKIIADSIVKVSYEQRRGGKVIGVSKVAEAQVIGEIISPVLFEDFETYQDGMQFPVGETVNLPSMSITVLPGAGRAAAIYDRDEIPGVVKGKQFYAVHNTSGTTRFDFKVFYSSIRFGTVLSGAVGTKFIYRTYGAQGVLLEKQEFNTDTAKWFTLIFSIPGIIRLEAEHVTSPGFGTNLVVDNFQFVI
ncbi:hypothetical protein ACYZT2_08840 [Pseudomonas sp. MDT1-85]